MNEKEIELVNKINKYYKICMMNSRNHSVILNQNEIKTLKQYIDKLKKEIELTQEVAIEYKRKYEIATNGETTDDIECLFNLR